MTFVTSASAAPGAPGAIGASARSSSTAPTVARGSRTAGATASGTNRQARGVDAFPTPRLTWRDCGRDIPDLQCADARVPLDYDDPAGATTTVALARVPATDARRRIGSVFVNPGGPGDSGVQLIRNGFGDQLRSSLGGRFDIVGFDPRGVGESSPLHCFETADLEDDFFSGLPMFPYRKPQESSFFGTYRDFGRRCQARGMAITAHMSTADVARDLDVLRRAVGDTALTYLGFSYGSYIGNTYANLFPNRIRALAIDGVLDPRLWGSGAQVSSDRVSTQQAFREFLRQCDLAGARLCPFTVPGGATARANRLAAAVEAKPVVFDDGYTYSYDVGVADATLAMYDPASWPGYAAFLDELADAALGDRAAQRRVPAARAAFLRAARATPARATAGPAARPASGRDDDENQEDYENSLDAYYGNQCSDAPHPTGLPMFSRVGGYARAGSRFGPFWWWGNSACASWPTSADRYVGPWTTATGAPVLVVGNYFDGVTGYNGAVATSKLLPNSRLLSYAGWGHTAYGISSCVTRGVDAYLLEGKLPAPGTVCPANPNPFTPAARTLTQRLRPGPGLLPRPPLRAALAR